MPTLNLNLTIDKTTVGLDQVDNTSDLDKPISTLIQAALDAKEDEITAGTTAQYWRGDKSFQTLDGTAVANTPAGNIAATTVQDAINELDNSYCAVITSDVTAAANTTEQTLGTITIPAGIMGPNSWMDIFVIFDWTASANAKTGRIKFGGSTVRTYSSNVAAGSGITARVSNKGSLTSQIVNGDVNISNANPEGGIGTSTSLAVNTANAFDITITGEKASAGETLTLKYACLIIYNR